MEIIISFSDDHQTWTVNTPVKTISQDVLDWLCEALQKKLSEDAEGKKYLSK